MERMSSCLRSGGDWLAAGLCHAQFLQFAGQCVAADAEQLGGFGAAAAGGGEGTLDQGAFEFDQQLRIGLAGGVVRRWSTARASSLSQSPVGAVSVASARRSAGRSARVICCPGAMTVSQ